MGADTSHGIDIRAATLADCEQIGEIYRHYVEHTVATFHYIAPTVSEWQDKWEAVASAGRPFLVATEHNGPEGSTDIVGFAYLGAFRPMPAYDHTTEDTIYVREGHGGKGVGSSLMAAMLAEADPTTVRQIIAVIAADGGAGSIALHRRFGFDEVGRLQSVGFKHDRWIDCVYMQLTLAADAPE